MHSSAQSVALEQSMPPSQEPLPEQMTRQGIPGGQTTRLAHESVPPHVLTQTPLGQPPQSAGQPFPESTGGEESGGPPPVPPLPVVPATPLSRLAPPLPPSAGLAPEPTEPSVPPLPPSPPLALSPAMPPEPRPEPRTHVPSTQV